MADPLEGEQMVKVGGKWPFELRGREAFLMVVIMILIVGLTFLGRFSLSLWGQPFDVQAAFAAHIKAVSDDHARVVEAINENTYVNSVCFNEMRRKECSQLVLQMPDSLRQKIHQRRANGF